jgi:hypothetical protein
VIVVVWTGLILFWVRDENFNAIRPDAKMVERVDGWFAEIAMLSPLDSVKFNDLTAERRSLIQKASGTGAYYINGHEQKLTSTEIIACKAILESSFSKQVKDTLVMFSKSIESARSTDGMQHSDHYISETPMWDFRGVDGFNLDILSDDVQRLIHQLNEIEIYEGGEYRFTGKYTGLVTENDLSLLDDLRNAQKSRWILKPLFWVAAWIVPLLGLGVATLVLVELCRWIVCGFRPSAQSNP